MTILELSIDLNGVGRGCVAVGDAIEAAINTLKKLRELCWNEGKDAETLPFTGEIESEYADEVIGSYTIKDVEEK